MMMIILLLPLPLVILSMMMMMTVVISNMLFPCKYMYDPKCFTMLKKLKTNNINKCSEVNTCVVIKAKKKKLVVEVS